MCKTREYVSRYGLHVSAFEGSRNLFFTLLIIDDLPLANIVLCNQYRAGPASLLHIYEQQR